VRNGERRTAIGLFDDILKGKIVTGLALGIGAAVVAPVVLPVLAAAAKPLAKAAIKSGILLYDKGKETFAELGEVVDDLIAEAKSEIVESHAQAAPGTGPEA
jgi:galactitol-specific phosphotransferase system IIC component